MDVQDFINACRICLCAGAEIPIFETAKNVNKGVNYDKLTSCFGEKIEMFHGYPRNICKSCYLKVNDVIDFIHKYKETNKILENHLKLSIKQEFEENSDFDNSNNSNDNGYEVYDEKKIGKSKILFDNAQQLEEFLKPLEIKIEYEPSKKLRRDIKIKTFNIKERLKTDKKNKITKLPEQTIRKPRMKQIAGSILEGEFIFTGDQWCTFKKKDKIEKDVKPTEKNMCNNKSFVAKQTKNDEPKSRLCDICGQTFPRDKLTAHRKIHNTNRNTKTHTCNICSRVLCTTGSLTQHMNTVHASEKNSICPTCGKRFTIQKLLNEHIKKVHLRQIVKKKKHPCNICQKEYSTKKAVLMHTRSAHTGERPAVCSVCDARFYHDDYLKEHMRLHTGETPYKCPVCNRGYAQRGNMKSHISHVHRLSQLDETTLKTIPQRLLRFLKP